MQLLLLKNRRQTAQASDGTGPTPSSFTAFSLGTTQKSTPPNPENNQTLKPGKVFALWTSKILGVLSAPRGPSPLTHSPGDPWLLANNALHPIHSKLSGLLFVLYNTKKASFCPLRLQFDLPGIAFSQNSAGLSLPEGPSLETDLELIHKLKSTDKYIKTVAIIYFVRSTAKLRWRVFYKIQLNIWRQKPQCLRSNTHWMGLQGTRCCRGKD